MSTHSDHPHTLQSDRVIPTRTNAPCKNIDSGKITQSQQKARERAKMRSQCESHGHVICATTIDTLTDSVLLEIFDFIRSSRPADEVRFYPVWTWHPLVHVCHRWREIVFASPLRLDLQLLCTLGTPVRKGLGYWPPTLPIAIDYGHYSWERLTSDDEDNLFTTLRQRDRVRLLRLSVTNELLEKVVTSMPGPFPELRNLAISSGWQGLNVPVPPDFLGGSAPSLREIQFNGIPFLALPTLLSSASNLVKLLLDDIPQTGYIPSAALAACLAVLPKLEYLSIGFNAPASHTDRVHPPPETRVLLPSLTSFGFDGHSTYLEVIIARIDTPQLDWINVTYTEQLDFRTTELSKFIECSVIKPSRFGNGEISLKDDDIWFKFFRKIDPDVPTIAIQIPSCGGRHKQVFNMAQVLNQTSAMLSEVVHLEITVDDDPSLDWGLENDEMDDIEWLELFRPFTAVKKLRIYEELVESITRALEGQTEEARTQVLPVLKSICVVDLRAREMKELFADLREHGYLSTYSDEGLDSDDSE
ncbi:hypothetical protein EDB89DRAFT_1508621 [Lactarius sanguifluus]|nr:hypothetical protein EDB89DRAFT_1508621 [Lactarius sanguifluus]